MTDELSIFGTSSYVDCRDTGRVNDWLPHTTFYQLKRLCHSYKSGVWNKVELSNGAFYFHPTHWPNPQPLELHLPDRNFAQTVSADLAGLIVTLLALSQITQLHKARDDRAGFEESWKLLSGLTAFAKRHPESATIIGALGPLDAHL